MKESGQPSASWKSLKVSFSRGQASKESGIVSKSESVSPLNLSGIISGQPSVSK